MLLDKPIEKRRSPSVAAEDGGLATTRAKAYHFLFIYLKLSKNKNIIKKLSKNIN
jgi:hypothetical protein